MKIAVEASITKNTDELTGIVVDDFSIVAQAPYMKDDIDVSDIQETLELEDKIKSLPNGEYHVFLIGDADYMTSYNWEYSVTEVDGIEIEVQALSAWQYSKPEPGEPIGKFIFG